MTFRNRLQYLLVKKLNISNKKALEIIVNGNIIVNNESCHKNIEINDTDSVQWNETMVQQAKVFIYIAFYKPIGIETTLNNRLPQNLKQILPFEEYLFPVGRLDKASEGLLLLTNDGKIYDKILRAENKIEKEYLVKLDRPIESDFKSKMESGVQIIGKITRPSKIEIISNAEFKIILIEGRNRQIRRMCYKLGYEVVKLIRLRIGTITLENLKPLEYRYLDKLIIDF